MHFHDVIGWEGPMTWRQYKAWQSWLEMQWNQPSRTDHYMMLVAAEERRGNAKNPNAVKLSDMKIPFKFGKGEQRPKRKFTDEEQTAMEMAYCIALAGGKPVTNLPDKYKPGYKHPRDPETGEIISTPD